MTGYNLSTRAVAGFPQLRIFKRGGAVYSGINIRWIVEISRFHATLPSSYVMYDTIIKKLRLKL
jgi:hypothetical protein